jgi:hypothetical protein
MIISKGKLERMFPGLPVFWTWANVPDGYETKTQLKKAKLWKDNMQVAAIKGNVLNSNGYIPLYKTETPTP